MTEHLLTLGTWRVWYDLAQTSAIYSRIASGSCEDCACDCCKWFVQNREDFYPKSFLELLETLGIDYRKEAELVCYGHTPAKASEGWFFFTGRIDSGSENLQYLNANFCLNISDDKVLLPEEFEGLPIVQLNWTYPSEPLY